MEGHGEPVILIHGLSSSGQMNWRAPGTIKELADSYQVIALDVRGHGGSDKPEQAGAYGVEMVEDVIRLMDHLHIEKIRVVGYSMGGMITLKLLAMHPERVKSAVLGGMGWLREGSALQDFWSNVPERRGAHAPSACVRSLGELAMTKAQVKAICVPVAILIGDRDPVRRLYVAPLQAVRPDWPVTVITDAGHLNCIFKTQFKEALKQQLDRQQKPPNSKPQVSGKI